MHIYKKHKHEKATLCKTCGFITQSHKDVSEHRLKHKTKSGWRGPTAFRKPNCCRLCDFSGTFDNLRKHYTESHMNEKHFKCSICEYSTHAKSQLTLHVDGFHTNTFHKCNHCDFETKWPAYLEKHTKSRHTETYFKCSVCDYGNKWKVLVNSHERNKHGIRKKEFKKKIISYKDKRKAEVF